MKKFILSIVQVVITLTIITAQENDSIMPKPEISKFSFGIYGGIGYNIGASPTEVDEKGFDYYEINENYSIGMNLAVKLSKKIKTHLEFGYSQMQYGMYWDDIYTDFYKTDNKLHSFSINVYCDYLIYNSKKIQLFLSPGVVNELVFNNEYTTILTDGNFTHTVYSAFSEKYPNYLLGGSISLLAEYSLTKHIKTTLQPSYVYFFQKFESSDNAFQRLNVVLGVELSF